MKVKNLKMYGTVVMDDGTEMHNVLIIDSYKADPARIHDQDYGYENYEMATTDLEWEEVPGIDYAIRLKITAVDGSTVPMVFAQQKPYSKSFYFLDKDYK